jgi:transcriptional regulator with XRE-family HTH domain
MTGVGQAAAASRGDAVSEAFELGNEAAGCALGIAPGEVKGLGRRATPQEQQASVSRSAKMAGWRSRRALDNGSSGSGSSAACPSATLGRPGLSYAYISRIEADARMPSVKALRLMANKLGVTVEHLEKGEPTPTELGVADAGLEFGSLTKAEVRAIRAAAAEGARAAARRAAKRVIEDRREAEREHLRKRLKELGG